MRPCGKLSLGFSLLAPGKEYSNGESGGLGVQVSKVHLQSCQQVPLILDFSWPVSSSAPYLFQVKWEKGTVILPLF